MLVPERPVPQPLKKCLFLAWSTIILLSLPVSAQDLPAGTTLEARLSIATGSRISHPGDRIEATIIAPASVGGHILIPDGSVLSGVVENVSRIGLGLKQTTAAIRYNFDTLRLRNGETILIKSEVIEVETAKDQLRAAVEDCKSKVPLAATAPPTGTAPATQTPVSPSPSQ